MSLLNRRSRMCRSARGKRLELSTRDFTIFECLERYRYLRSTHLFAFAGGASRTRFQERLGHLFHEGYLSRPEQQWQRADARCQPVTYEIGTRAKEALRRENREWHPHATFLASSAHRQFAHSLMICECLASIALATRKVPCLRFVPWSEILTRAPESAVDRPAPFQVPLAGRALVPDGIFGIEYRDPNLAPTYRFFALEADRGTMPVTRTSTRQTSYAAKLDAYERLIASQLHREHWGVPNLFLLTVTTSEPRRADMTRELSRRGERPLFLFKAVEETALRKPLPSLLTEPWSRAGLCPFNIASPDR